MITQELVEQAAKEHALETFSPDPAEVASVNQSQIDFTAGANWVLQQQRWIPVSEKLPEQYLQVIFVVDLPGNYKHGKVYGGTYTGDPKSEYASMANGFSTPGWGAPASHWMLAPEPPELPNLPKH